MCGICGVVFADHERPVDRAMLGRMTDIMEYRGPDSHGFHIAPGIGLGIRRLSIIDLKTGDQPIANEDETVTVVCNGEIYNFVELRQKLFAAGHRFRTGSDVEVIVHLYEDYGVDCLQHLRGMFGFALWDARRHRLLLARDRLGIKPLHYALTTDALYFASELKSILIAEQVERQINLPALSDLFIFGFVTGAKTLFTKLRRLPPGHYLLYQDGMASLHQYWDLHFPARGETLPQRSPAEWAEALFEKLTEAVRLHLRSDVPVGAWLSPGIDSSSVVALMRRLTDQPVHTFTLSFEDPELDEVRMHKTMESFPGYDLTNERAYCGEKDFERFPKTLWHCEEPSAVEIPRMILAETAARDVKVILNGEGSDEVFGGYGWYQLDKLLRPLARLPLSLRRLMLLGPLVPKWRPRASRIHVAPRKMNLQRYAHLIGALNGGLHAQLFSSDFLALLSNREEPDFSLTPPEQFETWHPFTQLQYYDLKIRLPDFVTHSLDRASMAYSLEARVPYLDHELVEFCARIPPSLKMRWLEEKYILRQALGGILPQEILQRRKRGLAAPYQHWLRGRLPDFATELFSRESIRKKGYFNSDFVAHLLAQHRSGRAMYGMHLMSILAVQLWDDLFLHGCHPTNVTLAETPSRYPA